MSFSDAIIFLLVFSPYLFTIGFIFLVWENRPRRIWFLQHIGRYIIRLGRVLSEVYGPPLSWFGRFMDRHYRAFMILIAIMIGVAIVFPPTRFYGTLMGLGSLMAISEETFFRGFSNPSFLAHLFNNVLSETDQ
jgi:hypothetical protein